MRIKQATSARGARLISRFVSMILALLLFTVSFGFLGLPQAAADHQPQAPEPRVYSVNFSATGQNVWGPGAGDAPNSNPYKFFSETWNENDTTRDKKSFLGMHFGGSIGGYTSGEIGLGAKFKGFTTGEVSINYPVDISLSIPPVDSFRAGQTVNIGSSMLVKPNASMTVAPSSGDIELVGTFAYAGGATAEICFIDCTSNFNIVPPINIPRQDGKILALSELQSVCNFAQDSSPGSALNTIYPSEGCEITEQMAWAGNLPFTGKLGLPNVQMTTTLLPDGKTLRGQGTHANFFNLDVDLTGVLTSVTGGGLGIAIPPLIPGVTAQATAYETMANVRISQNHQVQFSPTVEGTIVLPPSAPAVTYRVKNPQGATVSTGTGRTIIFDVGNRVEIDVPAGLNPGDVIDVAPTFAIKNVANFTNNVDTTFVTDLNSEALKVSFGTPRFTVAPSFVIIPRVCAGFLGCTSEVRSPEVVAPAITVGLGPVWSHTQPIFAGTDSSLFDGNQSAWNLGGFSATSGAGLTLNPQYRPVVSASGPAVLNEGQQGTYAFAFSDADNDPLTWRLEWGDGAVETGTGNPAGTSFNRNHTYADNGLYQVKLTVDDGHSPGIATQSVTVHNVAPVLSTPTLTLTLNEYQVATISGTITDPGIKDTFTLEIDWGGPAGQREQKDIIYLPGGTTSYTRTHLYKDDNPTGTSTDLYPVSVKVTDKDGGTDTKTTSTTVKNVSPTVFAGSDRIIDEGSFTRLGVELFGKNLLQGADAEAGTGDWANLTGGFATKPYGPPGSGELATITMYQDLNGTGASKAFPVADVSCLVGHYFDGTGIDMNDRVKSIRVPAGMTLTIYQHCGYGGWQATYTQGVHNFPAPDASSMRIVEAPLGLDLVTNATPGYYNESLGSVLDGTESQFYGTFETPKIILHQATNLTGASLTLTSNSGCLANHGWNDSAGSITVVNATVTLYAHCRIDALGRFPGLQKTYGPGTYNIVADGFWGDPDALSELDFTAHTEPTAPNSTTLPQPTLAAASGILGNWLSANPVLNGYWSGPQAIPYAWPAYHENAIVYPVDIPEGGSQLTGDFSVDNGIFVWVNGVYKFGAVQPGGLPPAGTYEYNNINLGFLPAGRHYIQVLREDHGGATGSNIRIRGTVNRGGTLAVDSPGPANRGGSYFGAGTATGSATQTVNVDSIAMQIDSGGTAYQMAGFFGGALTDTDHAKVTAHFLNGSGVQIGTAVAGPVTAADRANVTKLLERTASGTVPAGTRTIVVKLDVILAAGSTNQAGADNLSFFLLPAPGSKTTAGFTDPGLLDTHTAAILWGDGTAPQAPVITGVPGNRTMDLSHGYKDNGIYTVSASVADDDTGVGAHSFLTTVRNVAPTVTTLEQVYLVGRSESKLLASFTDPGALDTHTASINWGDGTSSSTGTVNETLGMTAGTLTTGTVTGTHTYNLPGPYPRIVLAQVTVVDKDGGTHTVPVRITLTDLEIPNATMSTTATTITEGGSVGFGGSFSGIVFPVGATTFTPTYDYVLDYGDGTLPATGSASPGTAINLNRTFAQSGTYVATLKIRAFDGTRLATYATNSRMITVNNAAPVIAGVTNKTTTEGGTISFDTSFTDAGVKDTHVAAINWGDGTDIEALALTQGAGSGTVSGSHRYAQDGTFTATITVVDSDGSSTDRSFTVTVSNVAPTVTPGPSPTVNEGTAVTLSASFTDPGTEDLHTATINWGDGFMESVTVNQAAKTLSGSHQYANSGNYTATISIADDRATSTVTIPVTVMNVAPTVGAVGNKTGIEGDTISVTTSYSDPGPNDTHTVMINWGDGTSSPGTVNAQAGTVSGSRTYVQDGNFTVTITVTDQDHATQGNGQGSTSFGVAIANVSPVVNAGYDLTINEGSQVSLAPASFYDPGTADVHTATINWGDGTEVGGTVGTGSVSGSHTYKNDGSYTVTVCVKDDGPQVCDTFTVTVLNVAPSVDAGADQTANEGDMVTIAAAVFDPGVLDLVTTTIDWADGAVTTGATGNHAYANNGRYDVTVCASDEDGGTSCDAVVITVLNVTPTVSAGASQTADEGDTVSIAATFADPGTADTHTATINWGDGNTSVGALDQAAKTVTGSHVYADNGTYTVSVCVTDSDNAQGCDTLVVTVHNVAPVVDASADQTVYQGSRVGVNPVFFTDPGSADTHTATINWGDGNTATGTVHQYAQMVTGAHSYDNVGTYTVEVCVTDKDGASDCDSMIFTVENTAPRVFVGPDTATAEGSIFAPNGPFTATVHASDFVGAVDEDVWSTGQVTASPNGERFLGRFGNDAVLLTLNNLPTHDEVTVSFDLYLINSWDGNGATNGPDIFEFAVADGDTLLRTTFSNHPGLQTQSYPGTFPGDTHPAQTGAAQVGGLGYGNSSTYRMTFTVPHTGSALAFRLMANNLQDLADESWGIDNVVVTVPVAAPIFADPGNEGWTATVDYGDGSEISPLALNADRTFGFDHVYADNGIYTVTVEVTDGFGESGSDSLVVVVSNVAPTLDAGADQTADEGSVVSLAPATFNDLGTLDTHTATVNWGDGTATEIGTVTESPFGPPGSTAGANGTIDASHVYADNGTYTVTVTVTDKDGATDTDTFTVTILNVAPTLDAGADQTDDEGSVISLLPATFNDLGTLDTHTATVNWGDGTATESATVTQSPFGPPGSTDGANGTIDASHVYADNGTYTVTVTVTDDDGATTTDTFTVTVLNVAPTLDAGIDQTVDEGSVISLLPATFNDFGTLDTHTATVNWGDDTPTETATVTESPFGPPGSTAGANGTIGASHVYADNGTYTVTVTVTDKDGATTTDTFTVTVLNVAPTLDAGIDQTVDEGSVISLLPATFNDKGTLDTHTATVNWGDGTATEIGTVTESPFGPPGSTDGANGTIAASHVYADNGTYTVTVTVTDKDNATTTDTFTVTVLNVAPTTQIETVTDELGTSVYNQAGLVLVYLQIDLTGEFQDQGTLDTHTAVVNWDDGNTTSAAVVQSPFGPPGSTGGQVGTLSNNHIYQTPGTYNVVLTVTDKDNATGTDSTLVKVVDAEGGLEAVIAMLREARTQPGLRPQATRSIDDALRGLAGANAQAQGSALNLLRSQNWEALLQSMVNAMKDMEKAETADANLNLITAKNLLGLVGKSILVDLIKQAEAAASRPADAAKIAQARAEVATGDTLLRSKQHSEAVGQYRAAVSTIQNMLTGGSGSGTGSGQGR